MYNQENYIYEEFTKNYTDKNTPLVIYGIGINTKNLLPRIKDYNIVGLMDGKKKTGELYGKPIWDKSDVAARKLKKIIILARPAVIGMIYYRIADFAKENEIFVGDIHGKDLALVYCNREYDLTYYHKNWSDLEQACKKHKIITFDVFDTLLIRKTLQPKDIFELVELTLKSSNEEITSFAKYRVAAEGNLCSCGVNPNIYQIYEELQRITGASDTLRQKYLKTELELEKKFIAPRQNMLCFFNKIKAEKEIYLISDMYLPRYFIQELLEKCGYEGYRDIYVSCEYNCSKDNGLFERFISEDYNRKNALHIGDNPIADGECARAAGLETFEIMSEYELLANSVYNVLLDKAVTILDKISTALFCARALDDPFVFFETKGKLTLNNHKDISYLFAAPEICYFSCWLMEQIRDDACSHVLYPSRDAYIIKKICSLVKNLQNIEAYPDGTYLYVSRRALLAASVYDLNDINHVTAFEYHNNTLSLFQNRFNIKLPEEETDGLDMEMASRLSQKYEQAILERCRYERNNYLKYLFTNNINRDNKIAFIDFVAAGTVQNGLRKILPSQICGYYFLKKNTNNPELENELAIKSFYPPKGDFELEANIYKFYLFFELILTSPEPTFNYMDEKGIPAFFPEVRSQKHIDVVIEMQEEILNFCREIASLHPCLMEEKISKEIPDQMVGFMGKEYSNITSETVLSLVLTDEYFATTFNIFDK